MVIALGIVVGFILGAVAFGWSSGIAGAFCGFIVALIWRSRAQARVAQAGRGVPVFPGRVVDAPVAAPLSLEERLAAIEARLTALERGGRDAAATAEVAAATAEVAATSASVRAAFAAARDRAVAAASIASPVPPAGGVRAASGAMDAVTGQGVTGDASISGSSPLPGGMEAQVPPAHDAPPGFTRTPEGTLEPIARADAAGAPSMPVQAADSAGPGWMQPEAPPQAAPAPHAVWAWITGGNLLTRIGVIALFVGVGFLLKELAQVMTVPIGVRLAGVAIAGAALAIIGARLAPSRPGYGVSLEGAGAGILYLTTFAALRLYDVLPTSVAFVLLVAVSVLTVWLAVRADSQPLAGLAVAGGFLAPFLVATSAGTPALLLGYFLVLNVAILALALVRSWRALNVLGFVFTFVLGAFWGHRFYRPEHFAVVEPFLIAFFLFYLAIAILYARRAPLEARRPVDGILVFGVPLVGFALQAALLRDTRYGVAISAFVLAALYAVLAGVLRKRAEPGLALLSSAFVALAVIFLTTAIPFAVDPQWTSAWWALEAAAVYWIGCVQRQTLARGFALLLQVGAALAFGLAGWTTEGPIFANALYFGAALIALSALATVAVADRHDDVLSRFERLLLPVLFVWGMGWWLGGGAIEIDRVLPERSEAHAMLAYTLASVVLALGASRALRWPRLAWFGAALLPVMMVVALADWERAHSTLGEHGWILWPAAWVVQWVALRAMQARDPDDATAGERWLGVAHAASAIGLVAWISWEASEWVGRTAVPGSVWLPCAAVWPAIFYLVAMSRVPYAAPWPFARFRRAYVITAATVVATLAGLWFVLANVFSPGSAPPLPYVPLLNPLDLTLLAVLVAVFAWSTRAAHVDERAVYPWLGAAIFLLVNAIVFRTVHQWLDVPWRFGALSNSKVLQAALTLTWTVTALPLMAIAHRRGIRPLWVVGAVLLAVVVGKLFLVDLSSLSGLTRIVAFIGVGLVLLVIGYVAPLPPAAKPPSRPQ